APTSSRCLFCRITLAQYACPTCQTPYCSLACFRSKKHEDCAVAFAKGSVREEQREGDEDGREEGGREGMMAILGRRTAGLTLGAGPRIFEGAQADDDEDEEEEELPALLELDARRHADFLAAWRPLLLQRITTFPPPAASTTRAPSLGLTPASSPGLLYNIAAVLATHAFITHDLDLPDLRSLHNVEEREAEPKTADARPRKLLIPIVQSFFSDLVPFLTASPPSGKKAIVGKDKVHETVLADAEDVVLWLLSRMQPLIEHAEVEASTVLRRMLSSAADRLEERKIVVTPSDSKHRDAKSNPNAVPTNRLEDILNLPSGASAETFYGRIHARTRARKLLFYAAVLASSESEVLVQVVEDLRAAVAGLQREEEVQRTRDGLDAWDRQRASCC
ncbi:hypothetical protein V8E36_007469, partial [Tilletia maclaganii]